MALQSLLKEVDPSWYEDVDAGLLVRAQDSALGRRLLARWLAAEPAVEIFAPAPGRSLPDIAIRWPRPLLSALIRDLGALAFAPAVRAEVRREPVRRLKQALGNSYLLALDNTVWNGRVDPDVGKRLRADLDAALTADATRHGGDGNVALYALLDLQGRGELLEWATRNDRALAEWVGLLHARDAAVASAHLPEKPVLRVRAHHQSRNAAN